MTLIIDSVKYLYLTPEYEKAILDFLGFDHYDNRTGKLIENAMPLKESSNRMHFINPKLPIVRGYWGKYYHLETFPIIYKIIFDRKFENAIIEFRSSFSEIVCCYPLKMDLGHWIPEKCNKLMINIE